MKTPNYFVDRTRNSQLGKKSAAMHHGIVTIPPLTIMLGNIIYEPIIYGNANKDYCYCYIRQMITIQ